MEMRKLGRSGLMVSRLCFGTLTMSPLQRDMPPEDGARLLEGVYRRLRCSEALCQIRQVHKGI